MGKFKLCVLDSCSTNSSRSKPCRVKLHRFPTESQLKSSWEKWIQDVGGPICKDFVATESTHTLCEKHFKPSDYLDSELYSQAVPSIPPCSLQTVAGKKNAAYTVAVFKRVGDSYTRTFLGSSYSRSATNGEPGGVNETSEQPAKGRLEAWDKDPAEFQCSVRAQMSLDMASDEVAKTKRKLETMQLKYVRATRRIKTLLDILNQLKEERDPVDCEIKVCSNCRKVNVCQ